MLSWVFDFTCPICCCVWVVVTGFVLLLTISTFLTPTFNYKGKHVLITGGSSGIGLEVAREYLRLGANVTIMARDTKRLESAKTDLLTWLEQNHPTTKQTVLTVSLDASLGQEAVDNALAAPIKTLGDVDVLINCAGVSIAGEFETVDASEFERMMRINVLGKHK